MISSKYTKKIIEEIPHLVEETEIRYWVHWKEVSWKHLQALKDISMFKDEDLAEWLNISVRSFREYKKPDSVMKENLKEQIIVLLSLVKHGIFSFGSAEKFYDWLHTRNFYFDNGRPCEYLQTITGIRFIDDMLTNMDYGNNA